MNQLTEEYTVYAHSPSLNQEVRQFNLEGGTRQAITDRRLAEQWARAFAESLSQQGYMQASDWVSRVKFEQLGLDTFINSQNALVHPDNNR